MARNLKAENAYMKKVFRKIPKLPKGIDSWVRNNPLNFSKYLFCYREKGIRYGYCTHCGKISQLDGPKRITAEQDTINGSHKHNEYGYCPACHSKVQFKDAGRGRGKLYDYSKFLIILCKDNGIFLRFFDVVRDYRKDYHDVQTEFNEEYRAFFCDGKTTMWKRPYETYYGDYYCRIPQRIYSDGWKQMAKVRDGYRYCMIYKESQLEDVFKGTPFQYCMYREYERRNGNYFAPVRYLEKYCKSQAIEKLTKIGFTNLVDENINSRKTLDINWRGKTPKKILRLTAAEIKELAKQNPTCEKFNMYQFLNHKIQGLTDGEKKNIVQDYSYYSVRRLPSKVPPEINVRKVFRYIAKQGKERYYRSYLLNDWLDYIGNCKKLKYNLKDESTAFPKDFKKAHDRAYVLVVESKNKVSDDKIRAMYLKKMKRYAYSEVDYILTVASCATDLIREGQLMHHCVGTYIDRVANDECTILFIRSTADPDKPLATAEVRGNEPIQIRAYNDGVPEKAVMDFWERFKIQKLNKKKQKVEERKAG